MTQWEFLADPHTHVDGAAIGCVVIEASTIDWVYHRERHVEDAPTRWTQLAGTLAATAEAIKRTGADVRVSLPEDLAGVDMFGLAKQARRTIGVLMEHTPREATPQLEAHVRASVAAGVLAQAGALGYERVPPGAHEYLVGLLRDRAETGDNVAQTMHDRLLECLCLVIVEGRT